ncbi:hypothetical protein SUGI_1222280 [Cryptomeria japonica]|uniref:F-box domain-containing protein n=1 Tax=Cryptomeria japonica TaxID=3369 RepID=A0AAD3NNN9_CRYJA|nr:hypothetical protein SUGI_1222120 [Cryptomeria japonica]GLJ56356.1 hypothetical protein SUGI_1222130 [Cryptomeria japonica]GLJ56369.1 hypothetical protein SUGI_1222280 [Cryptomeria japonica]
MERKSITTVEGYTGQGDISKLPQAMKELIFGKLTFQSIWSSRMVCKEWNFILSSQSFLSSLFIRNLWLLICGQDEYRNWCCMVYCFSAQKWMTLPLFILPNPEREYIRDLSMLSIGQGLLLFRKSSSQLFVCNPLDRSYAEIEIDLTEKFVHIVEGENKEPYLVVCSNSPKFNFQIYHYVEDSWRIKCQFAWETRSRISCHEMVECNGVLFWKGASPTTIISFKIQDEGFINPVTVAPLPRNVEDMHANDFSMVSYGSSILVVGIFDERYEQLLDMIERSIPPNVPWLGGTHPVLGGIHPLHGGIHPLYGGIHASTSHNNRALGGIPASSSHMNNMMLGPMNPWLGGIHASIGRSLPPLVGTDASIPHNNPILGEINASIPHKKPRLGRTHPSLGGIEPNKTGIVIWELAQDEEDKLVWNWKEFARMPPQSLPQYLRNDLWYRKCACVGDYLCFSSLFGGEVFAYNLKEGFWQRLPPCKIHFFEREPMMMSFEPKLNHYQFLGKLRE